MNDTLIVMSTLVVAIATVAYVIFTWQLLRESRSQRVSASRPRVAFFPRRAKDRMYWVVQNYGGSPACNIEILLDHQVLYGDFDVIQDIGFLKYPIHLLAPGKEIEAEFTLSDQRPNPSEGVMPWNVIQPPVVGGTIQYRGVDRSKRRLSEGEDEYQERFSFDVRNLEMLDLEVTKKQERVDIGELMAQGEWDKVREMGKGDNPV